MFQIKTLMLLIVAICTISSCRLPLEIYGEGNIDSDTGTDCTLEESQVPVHPDCSDGLWLDGMDQASYTAAPRSGWVFKGWKTHCDYGWGSSSTCSFGPYSDGILEQYMDHTFWPLRAEFVVDCTGVPNCTDSIAPILGAVTDTSIKIWGATSGISGAAVFKVRYRIDEDPDPPWSADIPANLDATTSFAGTIELTGLTAGTQYEYQVLYNDVIPANGTGTFSTLPAPGFTGQVRFGMGNDFDHRYQPYLALSQAAAKNFDFMLMIGDLMYSDFDGGIVNEPAAYRGRYWNTWSDPNFTALSTTTPMFMMWDDHEIDDNFWPGRDGFDPLVNRYPAAREAYDTYVHSHNPNTAPDLDPPFGTSGDVLYYSFSAPGVDFFVLDTRSYRSPPGTDPYDPNKTMLGSTQLNALLDYLAASTAPFKFIVTTVPFSLGEASDDTWSNYRIERNFILSEIEDRGITNVAFLSGDRHFSGIYRIISPGGHVYYDFLPSPTGTTNRPAPVGNPWPDDEEIVYISDTFTMFGDFRIDLSKVTPTLRAAFVDDKGKNRCVITIGNDETGVLAGGASLAQCASPPGC